MFYDYNMNHVETVTFQRTSLDGFLERGGTMGAMGSIQSFSSASDHTVFNTYEGKLGV